MVSLPSSAETPSLPRYWVDVRRELPIDIRYLYTVSAPSPMALPRVPLPRPEMPLQPARVSSMFRFARWPKIFGPALSEHFRYDTGDR